MIGARNTASPLNACAKLSRCVAVAGSPSIVAYGFAAVSKKVSPLATINNAPKKKMYLLVSAAGKKSKQPIPNKSKPIIIPDLNPYLRITNPAGNAIKKYAAKTDESTSDDCK